MKNLKKLLAVALAVAMMITAMAPAFAQEAAAPALSADATICKDLGMLLGADGGVTPEYTATKPSRIQAAVMFLRLKGLEDEARAFTGTDNFSDVTAGWEKPYTAYLKANPDLGFVGIGDNKFDPNSKITAAQYYKVVLTALGYVVKADANAEGDYEFKDVLTFAASKGLKAVADVTEFTVDNLATATVEGLKATVKGENKTLVEKLVEAGTIDASKAEDAGIYSPVPPAQALDIDNVVALNSKVLEVTLNTAVTSTSKSDITVKDSAGKAIAVVDAKIAEYDPKNKTLLFTLESDTTSGTVYTATNGNTSINFGGKSVDTTKPELESNAIKATDYNEISIDFDEPVVLDGATVTIAEKYGDKNALAVSDVRYGESNMQLRFTTAAQTSAKLYAVTVSGVKDFAGNVIDTDSSQTFAGKGMPTDALKVVNAVATDCDTVLVQFNVKVDPSLVAADKFSIMQQYGSNTTVTVNSARLATTDDYLNDTETDKVAYNDTGKYVVLNVEPTMTTTQYKLTVSGLKTLYGKSLSGTSVDTWHAFTGKKKPSDAFKYSNPVVSSNTTIQITFDNKVTKATAENIANYSIALAYGTKAALAVKKAVLDSDNQKTVTLTTDSMASALYKLTVTGITDLYGNSIKTADNANVKNFSGIGVADAITKITSITRPDTDAQKKIIVTFNQSVGDEATDVSHYFIDNGVGYPTKAKKVSGQPKQVELTIGETKSNVVYTLTVKNLPNADGVAMAEAGVKATFVGNSDESVKPQIQAVIATDNQTLKIYLDRSATDSSMDRFGAADNATNNSGRIWDSMINKLISGQLTYTKKSGSSTATVNLGTNTEFAWQDSDDPNILVVRVSTPDAFASANVPSDGSFVLHAPSNFDPDYNDVKFAPIEDDPAGISIDSVQALDKKTLRVYFSSPAYDPGAAKYPTSGGYPNIKDFAKVGTSDDYNDGSNWTFASAAPIDDTFRVWDFVLSGSNAFVDGKTYYLIVNPTKATLAGKIGDTYLGTPPIVTMADEDDSSKTTVQQVRVFAGNGDNPASIDDIDVAATDTNTLVVYYPEAMDQATAENPANYNILASGNSSSLGALMSDGNRFTTADIGEVWYDKANYTATIKLLKSFKSSANTVYLNINGVKNVSLQKDVDNTVYSQVALSDADPAPLAVTSATYDGLTGKLTLFLNMQVVDNGGFYTSYDSTKLLQDFDIEVLTGTNTYTPIDAYIQSVTLNKGVVGSKDSWIDIQLNPIPGIVTNGLGTVNIDASFTTGSGMLGVNGQPLDDDMTQITFQQKAGH
ncbi:MAG: hypothetical protein QHH06_15175 [Clostridiales bacterium]|nr:hypothetical protein [Eubacteriales bacterium]MDH7567776.1 hypothetical protein [Clostridiales bacterium]